MTFILPPKKDPLNEILKGLAGVVPDELEKYQKRKQLAEERKQLAEESQAASDFTGMDISRLSAANQQGIVQQSVKDRAEANLYQKHYPTGSNAQDAEGFTKEDYKNMTSEERAKFHKLFSKEAASFAADVKQEIANDKVDLGNKPITQEQQEKIDSVINSPEWQNAPSTKKNPMLLKAGVSRANTKQIMDTELESEKSTKKYLQQDRLANRKATEDLRKDYAAKSKFGAASVRDAKYLNKILKKGDVDSPAYIWATKFAPELLQESLLSDDTLLYQSGLFQAFGALREMFVGQTRTKEIDLLEEKIPGMTKSHSAKRKINEASIMRGNGLTILGKHAADVEREMPYIGPAEFEQEVNRRAEPEMEALYQDIMDTYIEGVAVDSKDNIDVIWPDGKEVSVPKNTLVDLFRTARENDPPIELRLK